MLVAFRPSNCKIIQIQKILRSFGALLFVRQAAIYKNNRRKNEGFTTSLNHFTILKTKPLRCKGAVHMSSQMHGSINALVNFFVYN